MRLFITLLLPCLVAAQIDDSTCDDSKTGRFFVSATGKEEPCVWLADAGRQSFRDELCVAGTDAYSLCPETCGACTDNCEDSDEKFNYENKLRDCLWLRLRPKKQEAACAINDIAYACPETCDICDSPFIVQKRELQILHSSDNESSFQDPNTLEEKLSKYAHIVKLLQTIASTEGIPSLHLTAGDHTIPGPFYEAAAGTLGAPGLADILSFNAMSLDANGIGNHEFDGGINEFAAMLSSANYPFVSVNLDFSKVEVETGTPPIEIGEDGLECQTVAGKVVRSCFISTAIGRVGVLGRSPAEFFNVILDPEVNLPGLDFFGGRDSDSNQPLESAVPMVLEQVDLLESAGIDIIVLLDHAQDFTGDPLSANLLRGVDIIVAAGSSGFVAQSAAFGPYNVLRDGDTSGANYPLVRTDSNGDTVLVVNSDQLYTYVGNLIAVFNDAGKIISWDGRSGPIATTDQAIQLFSPLLGGLTVESNAVVDAILSDLQATDDIKDGFTEIGSTIYPLSGARADVRSRETNLAKVVADSTLWAGNLYAKNNNLPAVDIGFKNGGGIRDSITGPSIIGLTIKAALAFNNKLALVELTAMQLIATVENAVSRATFLDGRYPQVSGFYLEYDETKPGVEGLSELATPSRVKTLIITKADGTNDELITDFTAVGDLSRTFTMATNNFLTTGGDGYASLAAASNYGLTTIGEQQILADYITQELNGVVDIIDPPLTPSVIRLSTTEDDNTCSLFDSSFKLMSETNPKKYFNRISTFPVCLQLDGECNVDTETVAETVAASPDGLTLVYSDSEMKVVGFVDITDPSNPLPLGTVELPGEPTSVNVWGDYAVVGINTSEDFINTSGLLAVIPFSTQEIAKTWDLGGQPDSVAISPDQKYVAIAIENERDEDLGEGIPPQMPAGYVVSVKTAESIEDWEPSIISVTGLKNVNFPEDPEPEFIAINENNIAVLTLQENNAIILIDLEAGIVLDSFSAGNVDLMNIDVEEEGIIDQTSSLEQVPREPDGTVFLGINYFATADEGDMDGGSRGFTIFNVCGDVVYGSGNFLDQYAASVGHYPDERSGNKGVEPENIQFDNFNGTNYIFVNAERAGLIFVYDATDVENPIFKQALPANVGPEGSVTIADRGLFVAANEKDDRGDKIRSTITIYQYGMDTPQYPTLQSVGLLGAVAPTAFAALSGLSPDPKSAGVLYSLEDSFYKKTRIFKILTGSPSLLVDAITINDDEGIFAATSPYGDFTDEDLASMINDDGSVNIDGEGIAKDDMGNFFVAHEGRGTVGDERRPIESLNFIFHINESGTIQKVITLPDEWNDKQLRFGLEGIAYIPDSQSLVVVLQRAWGDDENPAIGVYSLIADEWITFGFYTLDEAESPNGGWVGLSDITYIGDGKAYVLERDNQGATDARIKKIYMIDLNEVTENGQVYSKTLVKDILKITDGIGALPFEKYEGLAFTDSGVWIVNDNDGVDDNSGEIQLLNLGNL